MTESHGTSEFYLEGYQKPSVSLKPRGGTSIYVKNGITFHPIDIPDKFEDSSWISIKTDQGKTRVYACVYRSPNSSTEENEKLVKNITWVNANYEELLMVGDYNLPSIDWMSEIASGKYQSDFLNCVIDNNLDQLVEEPTRHRAGQEPSLLDLILVSNPEFVSQVNHEPPFGKSDHEVITFNIINGQSVKESVHEKYNFKKTKSEEFENLLIDLMNSDVLDESDMTVAYSSWAQTVREYIEQTTPKFTPKERRKAPWSTRQIEKLARKKRKTYDRYKHSGAKQYGPEFEIYSETCRMFNNEKDKAVRRYEEKIVANKNSDPKRYYSYLSSKPRYRDTSLPLQDERGEEHSESNKCMEILNNCYAKVFTKGRSSRTPIIKTPRTNEDMAPAGEHM